MFRRMLGLPLLVVAATSSVQAQDADDRDATIDYFYYLTYTPSAQRVTGPVRTVETRGGVARCTLEWTVKMEYRRMWHTMDPGAIPPWGSAAYVQSALMKVRLVTSLDGSSKEPMQRVTIQTLAEGTETSLDLAGWSESRHDGTPIVGRALIRSKIDSERFKPVLNRPFLVDLARGFEAGARESFRTFRRTSAVPGNETDLQLLVSVRGAFSPWYTQAKPTQTWRLRLFQTLRRDQYMP